MCVFYMEVELLHLCTTRGWGWICNDMRKLLWIGPQMQSWSSWSYSAQYFIENNSSVLGRIIFLLQFHWFFRSLKSQLIDTSKLLASSLAKFILSLRLLPHIFSKKIYISADKLLPFKLSDDSISNEFFFEIFVDMFM